MGAFVGSGQGMGRDTRAWRNARHFGWVRLSLDRALRIGRVCRRIYRERVFFVDVPGSVDAVLCGGGGFVRGILPFGIRAEQVGYPLAKGRGYIQADASLRGLFDGGDFCAEHRERLVFYRLASLDIAGVHRLCCVRGRAPLAFAFTSLANTVYTCGDIGYPALPDVDRICV